MEELIWLEFASGIYSTNTTTFFVIYFLKNKAVLAWDKNDPLCDAEVEMAMKDMEFLADYEDIEEAKRTSIGCRKVLVAGNYDLDKACEIACNIYQGIE